MENSVVSQEKGLQDSRHQTNIIAAEGFRPMKENGIISTDQIMQRGEKRQILFFHIKGKKSYFLKRIKAVDFRINRIPNVEIKVETMQNRRFSFLVDLDMKMNTPL